RLLRFLAPRLVELADLRHAVLRELVKLPQRRQILEILQIEELEELLARPVQHRPPRLLLLAEDADEAAVEEDLHGAAAVHAADLVDLGAGDRLAVGDDGEHLELRARELDGLSGDELAHPVGVHRVGAELKAAGDLVQDDPPVGVVGAERLDRSGDVLDVALLGHVDQPLQRQRLVRREQEALDDRLEPLRRLPPLAHRGGVGLDGVELAGGLVLRRGGVGRRVGGNLLVRGFAHAWLLHAAATARVTRMSLSPCAMRIILSRVISRIARNVTTMSWRSCAAPRASAPSAGSTNAKQDEKLNAPSRSSRSASSRMRSAMFRRSTVMSWLSLTRAFLRTSDSASISLNTGTSASGESSPPSSPIAMPRMNTFRPTTGRASREAAADLYFWYSSRRRMSSWRGSASSSGSSSSGPTSGVGRSSRDLRWASVAAMSRYSPATS